MTFLLSKTDKVVLGSQECLYIIILYYVIYTSDDVSKWKLMEVLFNFAFIMDYMNFIIFFLCIELNNTYFKWRFLSETDEVFHFVTGNILRRYRL